MRAIRQSISPWLYRGNMLVMGILLLIVPLLSVSCTQKSFDSEQALWEYLKDEKQGYSQHKTVNGIDFTLTYRPTDLLVKQEMGSGAILKNEVDSLRNKYRDYLYFNLSMAKNNKELLSTAVGSRQEFGAMVNQLAFGMEEKVHLITSKRDTLSLLDYVYPRMYGMSNGTSMMFVYPRDPRILKEEFLHITIEDIGLFTGEVAFKIPVKVIRNEPTLQFNKATL